MLSDFFLKEINQIKINHTTTLSLKHKKTQYNNLLNSKIKRCYFRRIHLTAMYEWFCTSSWFIINCQPGLASISINPISPGFSLSTGFRLLNPNKCMRSLLLQRPFPLLCLASSQWVVEIGFNVLGNIYSSN